MSIPLSKYDRETLEQLGKFGAGLLEDRVRALMVDRNKTRAENTATGARVDRIKEMVRRARANSTKTKAEARNKADIRARHYSMGVIDGMTDAMNLIAAALGDES